MQNEDGSGPLLTMVKWAVEKDLFLADFVQKCTLPHLALVTKGQYLSIGAPNIANPNLKPYVLVHSTHKVKKVLAQLLRIKEGKKKSLTEHKVAIPQTYDGYFEILSEDGRPVKCLESVLELCQKFPELCLIRQSCKAYLPDSDGELRNLFRARTIQEGEVLTLVGQFNFKRVVFLRCFDEQGQSVYLKLSQKGKFSPVARPDAITGVHCIENLISKRLPLTVRLIQGSHPPALNKALGGIPVVLQLQTVFTEEVALMYSVQKDQGQFCAVPLNAHLKLAPAINHSQIRVNAEFLKICQKCDSAITGFFDDMYVFNDHHLVYDKAVISRTDSHQPHHPGANDLDFSTENGDTNVEAVEDEEIDQLYDYIRGLAPLPDSCHRSPPTTSARPCKPPPPPIETIPSQKSTDSAGSQKSRASPKSPLARKDSCAAETLLLPSSPSNGTRARCSPATEQNSKLSSPANTSSCGLAADKRLDDMVYGKTRLGNRKLSRSSEKLNHHSKNRQHQMPIFTPPLARKVTNGNWDPGRHCSEESPTHLYGQQGGASNGGAKRRPLSMVFSDNAMILPGVNTQAVPFPAVQQDYIPAVHGQGLYGPFQHHHHQYPHPPLYHSFMNLSMAEDEPPQPFYASPVGHKQFVPHAHPPPYPNGFPSVRPVYTRYVPRYQYRPVYRV